MMKILPLLLKDGYKVDHRSMYPKGTTLVYSNMTPRKSRVPGVNGVMSFGMQYFVQEYLINQFDELFFSKPRRRVMKEYQRRIEIGRAHV